VGESWSELHQAYEGPWRDLVHAGRCVLQALLVPSQTGAICGGGRDDVVARDRRGQRNWELDRYSGGAAMPSFTIEHWWVAACSPTEVEGVLRIHDDFGAASIGRGNDLQMHVRNRRRARSARESESFPTCRAGAKVRAVRVGNGAWNQRQLDRVRASSFNTV